MASIHSSRFLSQHARQYCATTKDSGNSVLRSHPPTSLCNRSSFITSSNALTASALSRRKPERLRRIRKTLAHVSATNAILSLGALALGYCTLYVPDGDIVVPVVLGFVSIVQVTLIVVSWREWLHLQEARRVVLGLEQLPVPGLAKSPVHLLACGLESLFHLLCLSSLCQDLPSCILLTLFARNYHSIQWVYWTCNYSNCRYRFYAHLQRCESGRLTLKSCLRQSGFLVLAGLIGFPVLAESLLALKSAEGSVWTEMETAVYAITRVNGDTVLLLYGCLIQCFSIVVCRHYTQLDRSEEALCSEIQRTNRGSGLAQAAALIQCWWRMKQRCPWRKSSPALLSHIHAFRTSSHKPSLYEQTQALQRTIDTKINAKIVQMHKDTRKILNKLQRLIHTQSLICVACFQVAKVTEAPGTVPILRPYYHELSTIVEESSETESPVFTLSLRKLASD